MSKIIFIIGGARSGKSQFAIKLAKERFKKVAFIATSVVTDKEMKKRIARHKKMRPANWQTFEEVYDFIPLFKKIGSKFDLIIIDCLTLFISNLVLKEEKEYIIKNKIKRTIAFLKKIKSQAIIVSNEIGSGIVPRNHLARRFRDLAGSINQMVAEKADEVFFMISGLPLKIKGG